MKIKMTAATAALALSCLTVSAPATAADPAPDSFIYATYFTCEVGSQERTDEIVDALDAKVYDAAVKDGTLAGWGWMAHHTGGKWRRASFIRGSSVQALLDAQKKTGDQMDAMDKGGKLDKEFGRICNAHEDYIWRQKAGSQSAAGRGKMGFSVYYVCDMTREDQADAIVARVYAPVYDKLVADGQLVSWSWLEHIVGGQVRRVATMTAADLPTLMKARASVVQAFEDDPLGDVFTAACGSHSDYIWENKH